MVFSVEGVSLQCTVYRVFVHSTDQLTLRRIRPNLKSECPTCIIHVSYMCLTTARALTCSRASAIDPRCSVANAKPCGTVTGAALAFGTNGFCFSTAAGAALKSAMWTDSSRSPLCTGRIAARWFVCSCGDTGWYDGL